MPETIAEYLWMKIGFAGGLVLSFTAWLFVVLVGGACHHCGRR